MVLIVTFRKSARHRFETFEERQCKNTAAVRVGHHNLMVLMNVDELIRGDDPLGCPVNFSIDEDVASGVVENEGLIVAGQDGVNAIGAVRLDQG